MGTRIWYLVLTLATVIMALRANLLLQQADYVGSLRWLAAAVPVGLCAAWLGHRVTVSKR